LKKILRQKKCIVFKMDDLLKVMQLIDQNSEKFGDGEYLEICNHLKNAYASRTDPVYLFDHDEIENNERPFFFESFYEKAIDADYNFLQGQVTYLQKERSEHKKLLRLTKRIKLEAKQEYCEMMNLNDTTWEELSDEVKNRVFVRYMEHENEFRERYRETIALQIGWLQDAIDGLLDM
jgi:hypothetical protein